MKPMDISDSQPIRRGSGPEDKPTEISARPDTLKPRRKYRREPTSAHDANPHYSDSEDGSDNLLSTSEELEMDDMASDAGSEADEETGLTSKESRKYQKQMKSQTPLDARIAGDTKISKEEKKLADKAVVWSLLVNASLIGLWYIFSLSISIVGSFPSTHPHCPCH